jgi:hypothetical protein
MYTKQNPIIFPNIASRGGSIWWFFNHCFFSEAPQRLAPKRDQSVLLLAYDDDAWAMKNCGVNKAFRENFASTLERMVGHSARKLS